MLPAFSFLLLFLCFFYWKYYSSLIVHFQVSKTLLFRNLLFWFQGFSITSNNNSIKKILRSKNLILMRNLQQCFFFQLEKEILSFSNIFWTCGHPVVFLQIKCLASSSVICEDNSLFVTSSWCKWPKQTESLFLFFVFFSSTEDRKLLTANDNKLFIRFLFFVLRLFSVFCRKIRLRKKDTRIVDETPFVLYVKVESSEFQFKWEK